MFICHSVILHVVNIVIVTRSYFRVKSQVSSVNKLVHICTVAQSLCWLAMAVFI